MENLKRPETISGYTHPETNNSSTGGLYKTFTEGKKPKKKEKFGTTSISNTYKTLEIEDNETFDKCPVCEKPVTNTSNCALSIKNCEDGHIWYINREGEIKLGKPK